MYIIYTHFQGIFLTFSDLVYFRLFSSLFVYEEPSERLERKTEGRRGNVRDVPHVKSWFGFVCQQSVLTGAPVKALCGRAKSLQTRHGLRIAYCADWML